MTVAGHKAWVYQTRMVEKERKQHVLSERLLKLNEDLQFVSDKLTVITSKKEELYQKLQKKDKQRKFLMEQVNKPDELKELIEELDVTILKLNEQLDDLEKEFEKFTKKELRLKNDLKSREEEMEHLKKCIDNLSNNNTILLNHLRWERESKELEIRQYIAQKESSVHLQEELRVSEEYFCVTRVHNMSKELQFSLVKSFNFRTDISATLQ